MAAGLQYGRGVRLRLPSLLPLAVAVLVAACGGLTETSSSVTVPSTVDGSSSSNATLTSCTVGLNAPATVDVAGGRYSLTIAAGSTCSWTARTDVTWADLSPSSGQGNGTTSLAVQANPGFDTRSLNLIVNRETVRIVQNGRTCSYVVSPTAIDVGANETAATIGVTAPAECAWSATASESWIHVASASGRGTGTVSLQISPNTGDVRHASLTIAGQQVPVTQRRP